MQFKTFLFSVVVVALPCSLYAQDKIYKRDGDVIEAKIKAVGALTITYSRFDNQSGPEYTIIKNEVSKIKYQNGSEDEFDDLIPPIPHRHRSHSSGQGDVKTKYGPNVLSIAPLQFTENGLGFALSYERVLDKGGLVSFYLPVMATFNLNNGTYTNYTTGVTQNRHSDAMYYAMPGIILYPGGYGRVRYGIGPSIVIGTGEKSSYDYVGNPQTGTHNILGVILSNSLNINPGPHVYIGFEFGLGFTYLNRVDGLNQGSNALAQGGFKIGYRF